MLDACCALNFLASGYCKDILAVPLGSQVVTYTVADLVMREVTALRRGGGGEDADERLPIDWNSVLATGSVRLEASATSAELRAFVSLAAQVDDGEAMTIALAASRSYGIVTDDRKAQRFLGDVPCLGTPDLLHNWHVNAGTNAPTLGVALRAIEDRANFTAPRAHPLRNWWNAALAAR